MDVGCLLLADHPAAGHAEIVYLGLVPEVRGRAWGLELVRHAKTLSHTMGHARVLAAVDAANRPAMAVYERAEFFVWNRRAVWARACRSIPAATNAVGE
jgi:ribosomal protein S18 acetylase RimI-like enzyme